MSLDYIDQTADAIRLYLITSPFDIHQLFSVLDHCVTPWRANWSIEVFILGESHAVAIRQDTVPLVFEICACTDAVFPDNPLRSQYLHTMTESLTTKFSGGNHTFNTWSLDWEKGEQRMQAYDDSYRVAPHAMIHLSHQFPAHHPHAPRPVTAVWVFAEDVLVRVYSVHSYPNEARMIFTESVMTLGPE